MRFVNRTSVAAPDSLTASDGKGAKELSKARSYYGKVPPPTKCFDFDAYRGGDVKLALRLLFRGKCAYCESRISGTQPTDIEHFRPKGGVQERADHPGYWWLAASWANLLASCIDCNRRRGQTTARLGMTLAELESELATMGDVDPGGKHDAFPTLTSIWADAEQDPDPLEQPSLIDPTRTDPANHLVWPGGEVPVVLPVLDEYGAECPRGTASILIYALNRLGLVQHRAEVLQAMEAQMATIRELADDVVAMTGYARGQALDRLDRAIIRLREQAEPQKTYSAMAEAYIRAFERELQDSFDNQTYGDASSAGATV